MFQLIARLFRYINPFAMPTAEQVEKRYLEGSKRLLVQHSADAVYHSKMVEYHQANVNRLSKGTANTTKGMPRVKATPVMPAVKAPRRQRLATA